MKKAYSKYLVVIPVILALLLTGCAEEKRPAIEKMAKDSSLQKTADPLYLASEEVPSQIVFEGQDMEGNEISSAVFSQSKITMINVWATYCNPCLSEMPGLGQLAGEYAPEDFQIIGIISDVLEGDNEENINLAAELIEQTGADYTHLLLNESIFYALLTDVTAVPTTFFIDQNGVIVDTVVGAMEKSAWEDRINGLLEEQ